MIRIFFGSPGCGKTTTAVRSCKKLLKKIRKGKSPVKHLYSNFENKLSNQVTLVDLGQWTFPENSYVQIDEAGICYNSRKFKSLPQFTIEWFKLHRHFRIHTIDVFSQSWEDMDVTLRRLADELWYVRRLGPFTMLRRIYKRVGIDESTHQIIDFYEFGKILPALLPFPFHRDNIQIFLRKPYYKYFDSFSKHSLPLGEIVKPYDKSSVLKILNRRFRRVKK